MGWGGVGWGWVGLGLVGLGWVGISPMQLTSAESRPTLIRGSYQKQIPFIPQPAIGTTLWRTKQLISNVDLFISTR